MRKIALWKRIALGTVVSFSLSVTEHAGAQPSATRVEFALDSASVTLLAGQRPMIDVMINGGGPYRMLVETGSASSHLLAHAAARIHGPNDLHRSDTISFGTAKLIVPTIDEVGPVPITGIDGLLGLDAFSKATLTIDFPARRVVLHRDTLPAVNNRDIVAAHRSVVFWAVNLSLPSGSRSAILDTQNGLSLTVTPKIGSTFAFTTPPVTVGRARGPTVGDVAVQRARLDGVARIGDVTLEQPIVDLMPKPEVLPQDGVILGLNVLTNFSISLDQRSQRIRFARPERTVPPPPPLRSAGVTLAALPDGNRRVSALVDSLPGERSGMVVGDLVFEINGKPIKSYSDDEIRLLLAGSSEVRMAVRRGEEEVEFRFTPKPLGF